MRAMLRDKGDCILVYGLAIAVWAVIIGTIAAKI